MAAPNVLRKIKIDGKWMLLPVARVGDRYDWGKVSHGGAAIVAEEGTFYLEYRQNGRRLRRAVGNHPRDAKAALETQTGVLELRKQGVQVEDAPQIRPEPRSDGPTLAGAVRTFCEAPPLKYRKKSILKYKNALRSFERWSRKRYLGDIGREDVLGFMAHLVNEHGLDVSTAVDKATVVVGVMREGGAAIQMRRGDWPKITERQPPIYTEQVLRRLFGTCGPDEMVLFQAFLLSGMRDQEVGFLAWSDFDAARGTLGVTKKKHLGFDPKSYQERTVPVPRHLVKLLQAHRKRQADGEYLIFPTGRTNASKGSPGGQRNRHMLRLLKQIAFAAGLNCGHCRGTIEHKEYSCAERPICQQFGLHKFRHTYATTLLRDGVDLISLQKLLGHADLESTRKYLRALEPEELAKKINATTLATRFI